MAAHVGQMTGMAELDACYGMITSHGARTLHLQESYGIAVGKPANLIILDASSPYDAIRRRATVRQVVSRGMPLVQTKAPEVVWQLEPSVPAST